MIRCSFQAQEKLCRPFVNLGQDVTNRLKFKLKRMEMRALGYENPKDDARQEVLDASKRCVELNSLYLPLLTLSLFSSFFPYPYFVGANCNDTKCWISWGSYHQAPEKHAKILDSTGQDGHAVPVRLDSSKGDATHPVLRASKRYLELKLLYVALLHISSLPRSFFPITPLCRNFFS